MNRILNAKPLILICSITVCTIVSNDIEVDDYYAVLGVSCAASQADIRKSYFALAKKMHPDRQGLTQDAQQSFTAIRAAYDTLYDEEKRKQYDYKWQRAQHNDSCVWLCSFVWDLYSFYQQ